MSSASAQQVVAMFGNMTATIIDSQRLLGRILVRNEGEIHRRWLQKDSGARLEVLVSVWKDIPRSTLPQFSEFNKHIESAMTRTSSASPYTVPMINIEDLCQSSNLLYFLSSRGRNHPCHFAVADLKVANPGLRTGMLRIQGLDKLELDKFEVSLSTENQNDYGLVRVRPALPDMSSSNHEPFFTAETAIVILKAEESILKFLLKCCKKVMANDIKHLLRKPPSAPPSLDDLDSCQQSFVDRITSAQFNLPRPVDLLQLIAQLVEQKRIAEEHVRSLREDPAYFFTEYQQHLQHDTHLVLDGHLQQHSLVGSNEFTAILVMRVVYKSYSTYGLWDVLIKALELYRSHYDEDSGMIAEGYNYIIHATRSIISGFCRQISTQFLNASMASPEMRTSFIRSDGLDGHYSCKYGGIKIADGIAEKAWLLPSAVDSFQRQVAGNIELDILRYMLNEMDQFVVSSTEEEHKTGHRSDLLALLGILCYTQHKLASLPVPASTNPHILFPNGSAPKQGLHRLEALRSVFDVDTKRLGAADDKALGINLGELRASDFLPSVIASEKYDCRARNILEGVWEILDQHFADRTNEGLTLAECFYGLFERSPNTSTLQQDPQPLIEKHQTPELFPESPSQQQPISTFEVTSTVLEYGTTDRETFEDSSTLLESDVAPAVQDPRALQYTDDDELESKLIQAEPDVTDDWELEPVSFKSSETNPRRCKPGKGPNILKHSKPANLKTVVRENVAVEWERQLSQKAYDTLEVILTLPKARLCTLSYESIIGVVSEMGFKYRDQEGSHMKYRCGSYGINVLHKPYVPMRILHLRTTLQKDFGLSMDMFSVKPKGR